MFSPLDQQLALQNDDRVLVAGIPEALSGSLAEASGAPRGRR
jgi:hypothetical protein